MKKIIFLILLVTVYCSPSFADGYIDFMAPIRGAELARRQDEYRNQQIRLEQQRQLQLQEYQRQLDYQQQRKIEKQQIEAQQLIHTLVSNRESIIKNANNGDMTAQLSLGFMYFNNIGVTQDYVKARSWFEKAAKQGDPTSQHISGVFYLNGIGGKKDINKAKKYIAESCNSGVAAACNLYNTLQ